MSIHPEEVERDRLMAALSRKLLVYATEESLYDIAEAECVTEEDGQEPEEEDMIGLEELEATPAKMDDLKVDVQDPLEEVNLGDEGDKKPTFISQLLLEEFKKELIALLKEYRDYFA